MSRTETLDSQANGKLYSFTILHISDLHDRGTREGEAWRRRRVLGQSWIRNLQELRDTGYIDLVCFTGDLADWGKLEEYERASEFLDATLQQLRLNRERLFLVPGNHDIDRKQGTPAEKAWQALRKNIERVNAIEVSRWLCGGAAPWRFDDSLRDETLSRQDAYRTFLRQFDRAVLLPERSRHGNLGYHVSMRLPTLPFDIQVVGLDSSWLCGDDNDAGKLRLTEDQVMRLCTHKDGRALDGFRLALVHHPLGDLADGAICRRHLAEHADLLLRGHLHETEPELWCDPGRSLRQVAAGSLYEGHRGDQWPNACVVIHITCDANGRPLRCDLRFRSFSAGGGHWYDDGGLYKEAPQGRLTLHIAANHDEAAWGSTFPAEKFVMPNRTTLISKSRNVLLGGEKAFIHTVDVALRIDEVPQLVNAPYAPHIGARADAEARRLNEPLVDYLLRVEKLLMVGVPGAGKTQILRNLCAALLNRAESDPNLAVPFLINLSTFSQYRGSLRSWLSEGLAECAGIPVAIGQALLQRGKLFLLLDGFDEMAAQRQAVALTEINELLRDGDPALSHCVVCSRSLEYSAIGMKLMLAAAVELQPLTPEVVLQATAQAGPTVAPFAEVLACDRALLSLLITPLLLTVAARAFSGSPYLQLIGQKPEDLCRMLYDAYVVQMLRRARTQTMHPSGSTLRWLRWLAQHLQREQSSLFLVERLHVTLLTKRWKQKICAGLRVGLAFGLFMGGTCGMIIGYLDLLGGLLTAIGFMLVFSLLITLAYLIPEIPMEENEIKLVEELSWSWILARKQWKNHMKLGLGVGLFGFYAFILVSLKEGFGLSMNMGFGWGLGAALYSLITVGWIKKLYQQMTQPNQGIRASIRNGLKEGMVGGLVLGFCIGLGAGRIWGLSVGMYVGFVFALVAGLSIGLGAGLGEALRHYMLRFFLWREGHMPLRLVSLRIPAKVTAYSGPK